MASSPFRMVSGFTMSGGSFGISGPAPAWAGYLGKPQDSLGLAETCPWCEAKGQTVTLRSYAINHKESIRLCPSPMCIFPLVSRPLEAVLSSLSSTPVPDQPDQTPCATDSPDLVPPPAKRARTEEPPAKACSVHPNGATLPDPSTRNGDCLNATAENEGHSSVGNRDGSVCEDDVSGMVCAPPEEESTAAEGTPATGAAHKIGACVSATVEHSGALSVEDPVSVEECTRAPSPSEKSGSNLSWLNSLLVALAQCKTLRLSSSSGRRGDCSQGRKRKNVTPDASPVWDLCACYERASSLCQSNRQMEEEIDALQEGQKKLADLRSSVMQLLQHPLRRKLELSRRTVETPALALPALLALDSDAKELFQHSVRWESDCLACGCSSSSSCTSTVTAYTELVSDWHPLSASVQITCSRCQSNEQKKKILQERFPSVFALHFVNGLPQKDVTACSFGYADAQYAVTVVIQHKERENLYISWSRQSDGSWTAYNDFTDPRGKSHSKLDIPEKEIHMIFWEVESEDSHQTTTCTPVEIPSSTDSTPEEENCVEVVLPEDVSFVSTTCTAVDIPSSTDFKPEEENFVEVVPPEDVSFVSTAVDIPSSTDFKREEEVFVDVVPPESASFVSTTCTAVDIPSSTDFKPEEKDCVEVVPPEDISFVSTTCTPVDIPSTDSKPEEEDCVEVVPPEDVSFVSTTSTPVDIPSSTDSQPEDEASIEVVAPEDKSFVSPLEDTFVEALKPIDPDVSMMDASIGSATLLDTFEGLSHNDIVTLTQEQVAVEAKDQNRKAPLDPPAVGGTCEPLVTEESEPTEVSSPVMIRRSSRLASKQIERKVKQSSRRNDIQEGENPEPQALRTPEKKKTTPQRKKAQSVNILSPTRQNLAQHTSTPQNTTLFIPAGQIHGPAPTGAQNSSLFNNTALGSTPYIPVGSNMDQNLTSQILNLQNSTPLSVPSENLGQQTQATQNVSLQTLKVQKTTKPPSPKQNPGLKTPTKRKVERPLFVVQSPTRPMPTMVQNTMQLTGMAVQNPALLTGTVVQNPTLLKGTMVQNPAQITRTVVQNPTQLTSSVTNPSLLTPPVLNATQLLQTVEHPTFSQNLILQNPESKIQTPVNPAGQNSVQPTPVIQNLPAETLKTQSPTVQTPAKKNKQAKKPVIQKPTTETLAPQTVKALATQNPTSVETPFVASFTPVPPPCSPSPSPSVTSVSPKRKLSPPQPSKPQPSLPLHSQQGNPTVQSPAKKKKPAKNPVIQKPTTETLAPQTVNALATQNPSMRSRASKNPTMQTLATQNLPAQTPGIQNMAQNTQAVHISAVPTATTKSPPPQTPQTQNPTAQTTTIDNLHMDTVNTLNLDIEMEYTEPDELQAPELILPSIVTPHPQHGLLPTSTSVETLFVASFMPVPPPCSPSPSPSATSVSPKCKLSPPQPSKPQPSLPLQSQQGNTTVQTPAKKKKPAKNPVIQKPTTETLAPQTVNALATQNPSMRSRASKNPTMQTLATQNLPAQTPGIQNMAQNTQAAHISAVPTVTTKSPPPQTPQTQNPTAPTTAIDNLPMDTVITLNLDIEMDYTEPDELQAPELILPSIITPHPQNGSLPTSTSVETLFVGSFTSVPPPCSPSPSSSLSATSVSPKRKLSPPQPSKPQPSLPLQSQQGNTKTTALSKVTLKHDLDSATLVKPQMFSGFKVQQREAPSSSSRLGGASELQGFLTKQPLTTPSLPKAPLSTLQKHTPGKMAARPDSALKGPAALMKIKKDPDQVPPVPEDVKTATLRLKLLKKLKAKKKKLAKLDYMLRERGMVPQACSAPPSVMCTASADTSPASLSQLVSPGTPSTPSTMSSDGADMLEMLAGGGGDVFGNMMSGIAPENPQNLYPPSAPLSAPSTDPAPDFLTIDDFLDDVIFDTNAPEKVVENTEFDTLDMFL